MRPDGEAPLLASYEVGVVIGHPHVVDGLVFAGVVDLLHRHPLPVGAAQQVPRLQRSRRHPALAFDPERVLRCCPDHLPVGVQVPDPSRADEHLLHPLDLDRPIWIKLRARQQCPSGTCAKLDPTMPCGAGLAPLTEGREATHSNDAYVLFRRRYDSVTVRPSANLTAEVNRGWPRTLGKAAPRSSGNLGFAR